MQDMVNWIKVEDKIKSMKRSERNRGSIEIHKKIDLAQNDVKARAQKKTPQTRRFLRRSNKHIIILRRKAKLIRLRDGPFLYALHKERAHQIRGSPSQVFTSAFSSLSGECTIADVKRRNGSCSEYFARRSQTVR